MIFLIGGGLTAVVAMDAMSAVAAVGNDKIKGIVAGTVPDIALVQQHCPTCLINLSHLLHWHPQQRKIGQPVSGTGRFRYCSIKGVRDADDQ
jgi:hypothetical protein